MNCRIWGLYWAARSTRLFLLVWLLGVAVVLALGPMVFELGFLSGRVPRYTPVWEAVPAAVGAIGAGTLTPQLRSWEVGGRIELRRRAAAAALVALLLPGCIPWIAHLLTLPRQARWWDIVCNVVLLTAVALVATAMAGKVVGPLVGLGAYLAILVVQQADVSLARWLPVSGTPGNLSAHVVPAVLASCVAVLTWSWTLGASRWSTLLWRHDAG